MWMPRNPPHLGRRRLGALAAVSAPVVGAAVSTAGSAAAAASTTEPA
jgi:hypothetical protein